VRRLRGWQSLAPERLQLRADEMAAALWRMDLPVTVGVGVQTQEDPHRHSIPVRVSYQAADSITSSAVDDLA
jgi:hypothetical protein